MAQNLYFNSRSIVILLIKFRILLSDIFVKLKLRPLFILSNLLNIYGGISPITVPIPQNNIGIISQELLYNFMGLVKILQDRMVLLRKTT